MPLASVPLLLLDLGKVFHNENIETLCQIEEKQETGETGERGWTGETGEKDILR